MKKRTKNNLAQMAALLPELDAEHQRGILGGTAVPVTSPDYPEMILVSTVVASTVASCATPESTFLPTTTAFVPTPTTSSVVTSIPVPTITASPVETSTAVTTTAVPIPTMTIPISIEGGGLVRMSTEETPVDSLFMGKQFNCFTWEGMGNLSSGIGVIDDLSGNIVEGLGKVGTAIGVIDMVHKAVTLYDNGEVSSKDVTLLGIDMLFMLGGSCGAGVKAVWGALDYATKEFQEEGKNFIISTEHGMGKNGDFSSIKYYWGY